MVVLTLVLQNNGKTIFLDQAIPQVHFMKHILQSVQLLGYFEKAKYCNNG